MQGRHTVADYARGNAPVPMHVGRMPDGSYREPVCAISHETATPQLDPTGLRRWGDEGGVLRVCGFCSPLPRPREGARRSFGEEPLGCRSSGVAGGV